jgi:glutamate racemase
MKIGFFDSGFGGLTIMRSVAHALPEYDYEYYGDTKNLPYGDKSEEEIYELTKAGMRHLFDGGCLIVIIACNTASAQTARRLQTEFLPKEYPGRKVLGIIIPTIEVLKFDKPTKVALLATKRTIESKKYHKELKLKKIQNVEFIDVPTPELVPLIELAKFGEATELAIQAIDREAGESSVVALACSHYTEIKAALREHYSGEDKKAIISQDEVIPEKLKNYLDQHPELEGQLTRWGRRNVYLTEHRADYDQLLGQFLGGVYMGP